MGQIVTFYSYKGGVGRSMALANTAALLARWGYKTLMVDWDLEAPGLENFFKGYVGDGLGGFGGVRERQGLVDLLCSVAPGGGGGLSWPDLKFEFELPGCKEPLHLLSAGRRGGGYFKNVRSFDVQEFYMEKEGGEFIERLRLEWKKSYDLVLIDSRTGITDIGGICTIQLPDILVLLFTATEQGLEGTIDVARKAAQGRQTLPSDRLKLLTVPVASRFDVDKEFELSKEWLNRSAELLRDLYGDWLPTNIRRLDMIELTKIPYKAYFSFGEKLAVMEENVIAPDSLSYSYATLTSLLANGLEHLELLRESRDEFVRLASKSESQAAAIAEGLATVTPEMLQEHEKWYLGAGSEGKRLVLTGAKLSAADMAGAQLVEAVLVESDLSAANMSRARLMRADLSRSDLQGANLESAYAWNSNLQHANLTDANLQYAALDEADLREADLRGANLEGADFTGANLTSAAFAGANAKAAQFRDANLKNAALAEAVGLSAPQFRGANLKGAMLPEGLLDAAEFDSVRVWAKLFRWSFFIMAAACAFVFACVGVTTDAQIVAQDSSPPLFAALPLRADDAYMYLPGVLFSLYVVFHATSYPYWRALGRQPAVFPDGARLDAKLPAWVRGTVRANFARLGKEQPRRERLWVRIIFFLLWWLVPAALALVWFRYLTRHDFAATAFHVILLTVAGTAALVFRQLASSALRGETIVSDERGDASLTLSEAWWAIKLKRSILVMPLLGVLLLAVLSYGAIRGVPPGGYSPPEEAPAWYSPRRFVPRSLALLGLDARANLRTVRLDRARLAGRDLRHADAEAAYLKEAELRSADLRGVNLRFADLRGAKLQSADLSGAKLTGANLREVADLTLARLNGADLSGAWLSGANLQQADLRGAYLFNAQLSDVSLKDADLSGANLQGANLEGADLVGANLRSAPMENANLRGAKLNQADLRGANLKGADLSGADLSAADLTGAVITTEQFSRALSDDRTKTPAEWAGYAEAKQVVSELVKSMLAGERTEGASRLAQLYESQPKAVVAVLLDSLLPDEHPDAYRVNLYISTMLANIFPSWQGTGDDLKRVEALRGSRHADAAFKARVEEAVKNFSPAR